jgi:tyrosinase
MRTGDLFSDTDPESGIGGWGSPENDYQIAEGGFSRNFSLSYPIHHGLRRNYTATFHDAKTGVDTGANLLAQISPEAVDAILSQPKGNFTAFQIELEKTVRLGVLLSKEYSSTRP